MARKFSDREIWIFSESQQTEDSSLSIDVEVFWRQLTEKRDHVFELPDNEVWFGHGSLKSPRL